MHLLPLFTSLATLCTITAAIPVGHDNPWAQDPTKTKSQPSPSSPHHAAATTPLTPVGAYECPQEQYKTCCMSLGQTSKELMKPVGDLFPWVGGISLSSGVSFNCYKMAPFLDIHTCKGHGYAPMCCSSNSADPSMDACKPFEKAKEEYYKSFGYNVHDESSVDLINDVMS